MLEKIKKTIDRGIVSAGVQSTTFLETGKLRSKIDHVNDSIQQIKVELGQTVYANWKSGADNTAYIEEVCGSIRKLEQENEGYEAQIAELQAEKERVLFGAAAPVEASGVLCSCGQRNGADAKFCVGCGKPVEAAPPQESTARFCGGCGSSLSAEAVFCPNCGTKQENAQGAGE